MEEELKQKGTPYQEEFWATENLATYVEGKDELNLAEFPISGIGSRSDPNIKTLRFEDRTYDKASSQMIHRKLTITASDEYGLPTAADDEVLLGLLQMTRIQQFASPTVSFTPYKLMSILGWQPTSYNYKRIREAINRWSGVTLYYENAWRDKKTGEWKDATFHFIENAEFYRPGKKGLLAQEGDSMIRWNEIVFRNFREGNLKTLDFHFYRNLDGGVAKRMFRFLDKRFYYRHRLTFALEPFCCDKIGITRATKVSYTGRATVDVAQLKRRLMTGIKELEQVGFISTMSEEERFTKDSAGVWQVHFEKLTATTAEAAQQPVLNMEVEEVGVLEGRLIGHGVSKSQARRLVSEYDEDRVAEKLEVLEFLLAKGGENEPQNRGGWLQKAISDDYSAPKGFKSSAQLQKEAHERAETLRKRKEEAELKAKQDQAKEAAQKAKDEQEMKQVETYLSSLTPLETEKLEEEALRNQPAALTRVGSAFRKALIQSHVLRLLQVMTSEN